MSKTITYLGKNITIINQREKAKELGLSVRTFWEYLRKGKYEKDIIMLPGTTKKWYISNKQYETTGNNQ